MIAIEVTQFGGPECLTLGRRPIPSAAEGEVLLRVHAAGVNRPDILQRMGRYPPPPGASDLLGLEAAGEVVAIGNAVLHLQAGQRVCALLAGGGYAEYVAVPAVQCLPVPRGLSDVEAASLPETTFTVWHNIFDLGLFTPGCDVLIHGGTSGIGVMAIQMVAAMGGRVFATAGSDAKVRACLELGATIGCNYRTEDFVEVIKSATGGRGVDIILDMVGGDYLAKNVRVAATGARILQIAFMRGARAELDLSKVMQKRVMITGSTLRPRGSSDKHQIALRVEKEIWPRIERGAIRPVIDSVFPFSQAGDAHRRMESSGHIGKIVLTPRPL